MAFITISNILPHTLCRAYIHTSTIVNRVQAGRYKPTLKKNRPLTYEMSFPPHDIAHKKSWNSWNTSNLVDGNRSSETAIEDLFIRRFMIGTWHSMILSEVIIKRQHNMIRIASIMRLSLNPRKLYFLEGYTEELLSYWLQCPVKLEIQTAKKTDVIFKVQYIGFINDITVTPCDDCKSNQIELLPVCPKIKIELMKFDRYISTETNYAYMDNKWK